MSSQLVVRAGAAVPLARPLVSLLYVLRRVPTAGLTDTANAITTLPHVMDPNATGLFAKGKQIVKLYKSGIVNVWHNYKSSRELLKTFQKAAGSSRPSSAEAVTQTILDKAAADRIAIEHERGDSKDPTIYTDIEVGITRAQYQTLLRTPKDAFKLPLFSIIFCIFFETTPLLVMIFPGIVPSTCILPGQERKAVARREALINNLHGKHYPKVAFGTSPYKLKTDALRDLTVTVGAVPQFAARVLSHNSLARRLEAHLSQVRADSYMLAWTQSPVRENVVGAAVWALNERELVRACHARAIPAFTSDGTARSVQDLRAELFLWTANFLELKADAGFLLSWQPAESLDQLYINQTIL
ncbi:uncharacterized protein SAPINGB_P006324 [Magnusiomyces paraingens]|uniref:Letm1 RBD domain-containing protein n=1 Tax=Magnusiomyces paraingens TaxID=2606893 RepID=A0A5E8C9I2_9ASCO|nr:uncharacterized protein SAPINGB_P006324 [Saprochaete ingens]VVT58668.1 unnamed protein product [Saprochaete ingens]